MPGYTKPVGLASAKLGSPNRSALAPASGNPGGGQRSGEPVALVPREFLTSRKSSRVVPCPESTEPGIAAGSAANSQKNVLKDLWKRTGPFCAKAKVKAQRPYWRKGEPMAADSNASRGEFANFHSMNPGMGW